MPRSPVPPRYRPVRQRSIRNTVSTLPEPSDALEAVLEVLSQATDSQALIGEFWYPTAHDICLAIAHDTGTDLVTVAGILAVTSPQTPWSLNVDITRTACETRSSDIPHTADVARKVQRLLDRESPWTVLGGTKVRSFFPNVLAPTRPGPVTIDRHAASIIHRRPLYGNAARIERLGHYHFHAATYRSAGRLTGLLPQVVQATTWTVWRDLHAPGWSARDELHAPEAF